MTKTDYKSGDEILYNGCEGIVVDPKCRGVTIHFLYAGLTRMKFVKYDRIEPKPEPNK